MFKREKVTPDPPMELKHVWDWFIDIFNPSGYGMGPFTIEYQEIESFCRVTGNKVTPTEAHLIRRLSDTFVSIKAAESKTPVSNQTSMSDSKGLKELFARTGSTKKSKKAGS